jgi:hypothetical protein
VPSEKGGGRGAGQGITGARKTGFETSIEGPEGRRGTI